MYAIAACSITSMLLSDHEKPLSVVGPFFPVYEIDNSIYFCCQRVRGFNPNAIKFLGYNHRNRIHYPILWLHRFWKCFIVA